MTRCGTCGGDLSGTGRFCLSCGAILDEETREVLVRAHEESVKSEGRVSQIIALLIVCGVVAMCGSLALRPSTESQPYRRGDGRWSDDPGVRAEQLFRESEERHRRWESDCRTGRGPNPHCP